MEFQTWRDILVLIMTLLVGLLGSGLTQFLKEKYGLEDKAAVLLTAGVAAVLAITEMVLMGKLDWTTLDLQNFPAYFTGVFSVATLYYKLLGKQPEPPPEEPEPVG